MSWLKKYQEEIGNSKIKLVQEDAENLNKTMNEKFDIICIDIFKNRSVPAFVQSKKYLQHCFELLNENGVLFFNIIPNDAEKLRDEIFEDNFKIVFLKNSIFKMKENEMLVGEK